MKENESIEMEKIGMDKGIFLDRDGTLIQFPPNEIYVNNKPENLKFYPGTIEAIRFLKCLGYKIFVVTNQAGVSKGYSTLDDLISFNQLMINELEKNNADIDHIYYCIHDEDEKCECRKPETGMLLKAAKEFDIDLSQSFVIGDSKCDMQCGFKAGCRTILVETGHGKEELEKYNYDIEYNYIVKDVYNATKIIFSEYSIEYVKKLESKFTNLSSLIELCGNFIVKKFENLKSTTMIGIQTYNGLKHTKRLLYSLLLISFVSPRNIFVIDNSSTDGTLNYIKSLGIKHEILNPRQCSAIGMNRTLKYFQDSDCDNLLMLNNDIVLHPGFINTMLDDFTNSFVDDKCMLMCGVQSSVGNTDKQWDAIIKMESQDIEDEVMPGDFSAFIINKDTIKKIGYFDEIFTPRYIEDNDYVHRIYLSGNCVLRNGKCTFHHEGGQVNILMKENPLEILKRNSELYKEKWGEYQKGYDRLGIK